MQLIPLLAAVAVSIAVGMIWYSPYLFGTMWMKAAGLHKHDLQQRSSLMPMLGTALSAFLIAMILQHSETGVSQMVPVLTLLWLVFCVALRLPAFLYEGRPMKLYFIYIGHDLVNLLAIGVIVSSWR